MVQDSVALVLSHYDAAPTSFLPLHHVGGFSGARLWRVRATDGEWALKAWPPRHQLESHLSQIHSWMHQARASGLKFVPRIRFTPHGRSYVSHGGWIWDMAEWLPGEPITQGDAPDEAIVAACQAIGQLHSVWRTCMFQRGTPFAIQRRLQRLAEWSSDTLLRPIPSPDVDEPFAPLLRDLSEFLTRGLERIRRELAGFRSQVFPPHPCLGDVWREHVLFTEGKVRGIIDYGAARLDTPAVDLARLLGSLTCRTNQFDLGIRAYRECCALSATEERLVYLLDASGIVIAAKNWLDWLGPMERRFDNPQQVVARLEWTLGRLRQLQQDGWLAPQAP